LENWSLHELIDIVQAFLNHINPQTVNQTSNVAHSTSIAENSVEQASQPAMVGNAAENKLGLVLTDDDWSMLLSTPALLENKPEVKTEKIEQNPLLNINFVFPLLEPPQAKVELSSKDSPLSPPSM
jgi:hypothetical protein